MPPDSEDLMMGQALDRNELVTSWVIIRGIFGFKRHAHVSEEASVRPRIKDPTNQKIPKAGPNPSARKRLSHISHPPLSLPILPHLLLRPEGGVLERLGGLVLALPPVERPEVLQRRRHRRRVHL